MSAIERLIQFWRKHPLALSIAVAINLLVLANAVLHHPKVGYDVTEHILYMAALPGRLPTPEDTREYFSAPLPYFLPSLADKVCNALGVAVNTCHGADGKTAQFINVFLSIGITVLFWKLAEQLRPGQESFKLSLLAVWAVLTVYYRTFSQARGEPYVAFFTCLMMLMLLRLLQKRAAVSWQEAARLGIVLGLLILSRQWGFLIAPALAGLALILLVKEPATGWRFGRALALSGLVALAVGGWFYYHLYAAYGTLTAFNLEGKGFALSNQPLSFYRTSGLKHFLLFKQPIRPTFDNRFFPIFYSDTWGDYWCHFTCISRDQYYWTANREAIEPYLGRANLFGVFPSAILLGGLLVGGRALWRGLARREVAAETLFLGFLFLVVLASMAGFLWFVISYPVLRNGVTIKATYMIQVFMVLPVLAAAFLEKVREARPALYRLSLAGLLLVFLHNLPALVTRFVNRI